MNFFFWKAALGGAGLVVSASFSLVETSLMSLSRLQLARLAKSHPGRLEFWRKSPDRTLAVLLLANSLVNAGLGVLAVSLALDAERLWGLPFRWGGWIFSAAMGALVLVFGEVAPKVAGRLWAEPVALAAAGAARAMTEVFAPLMDRLVESTGRALAWLSRKIRTERAQWNPAVIRALLKTAPAVSPLRDLLNNVLDFGHVPVSKIMVPRQEIFSVDLDAGGDLLERFVWAGYSRVPVHRGSLDNVEGIVYAKDLLARRRSEALITVGDIVRPVLRVSAETPLASLLRTFREGRHHMALVTERRGRIAGLVTLHDILETIVGDLTPEFHGA